MRHRTLLTAAVLLAGAAAAAVAWYYYLENSDTPLPGISDSEIAEIFETGHVAVGYLENLQLDRAEPLLQQLVDRWPEEPLGIRNLAICQYLMLEQQTADAERLEETLDRLQEVEPSSPVAPWLRARVAYKNAPESLAPVIAHLEEAIQRDPTNPVYPYELYTVASSSLDEQWKPRARAALEQAHRLAPRNLFVLSDWLLVQAEQQDARILETLEQAVGTYAPLQASIQRQNRLDIMELLAQARQAADAGDWPGVLRAVRFVQNLVRPHDFAQSDKRALLPHPLEFAVTRFSPAVREKYKPEPAKVAPAFPLELVAGSELPPIAQQGARDALLIDFDLDGRLDVVLLMARQVQVLRYDESAKAWSTVCSVDLPRDATGLLGADLDQDRNIRVEVPQAEAAPKRACFDADPDFIAYGPAGVTVLRNDLADSETRTLTVVAQDEAVEQLEGVRTALLVDFDHDSLLDLIGATDDGPVLLLAQGGLQFANATEYSAAVELAGPITSLAAVDWDRDVDIDVLALAPAANALGYLENLRHGDFRWQGFDGALASVASAQELAVLDADGNVSWDILAAGPEGLGLVQTRTVPGRVMPGEFTAISDEPLDGCVLADLDNDGYQDAVAWRDKQLFAWRAGPSGSFATTPGIRAEIPDGVLQCEPGDVDGDGDLDLAVVTQQGLTVLENQGGNQNNWLAVRALGQVDNAGKANHNGLGSLLELKAGLLYQAQVVQRPITHFGLGQRERADVLRFLWTNGVPQSVIQPAANQYLCELMVLKGSCPYLYTWTGERFEFFTDCLWAAPIGLQLAENVLAPSRAWEYLRIPGDRLVAHEGRYRLQVTEELWEAAYFDQIRLIAVDHPADVEIYSNEKVGPAAIAEFKLHPVRERRTPVAARDQHGRDVLPLLSKRDEQYLRAFDKQVAPGLVDEHFVELDLGPLDSPRSITLLLTGWIYPTDTSTNVSLSRSGGPGGPQPPRIEVPDAQGNWQVARAYMGFPGGKTKTICIDLSDAFLTNDYRLRIVTSAQIYWDEAFFTVNEPAAETRQTVLEVESADLHYRGFSAPRPPRENAPETYDYAQVLANPKWPPMAGRFTRYGDVTELLGAADDLMVVMSAGDEMTVHFPVPAEDPPEGWVRDFILHNVGWDKDADLNTLYGQSAEPLPFNAMSGYPYGAEERFPSSREHQSYLRRYQTRIQDPISFWRHIRKFGEPGTGEPRAGQTKAIGRLPVRSGR